MEYVSKSPEQWKIGLNVDSKSGKVEPVVLLHLSLDNGQEKVIEVSIEKFHALRQRSALLLKHFLAIKEKL